MESEYEFKFAKIVSQSDKFPQSLVCVDKHSWGIHRSVTRKCGLLRMEVDSILILNGKLETVG